MTPKQAEEALARDIEGADTVAENKAAAESAARVLLTEHYYRSAWTSFVNEKEDAGKMLLLEAFHAGWTAGVEECRRIVRGAKP